MAKVKKTKFIIEAIDQLNGNATIKFINLYGDIETGKKKISDFILNKEIETGSFQLDGTPIMKTVEVLINDNPNEDLVLSLDLPLNENNEFISGDELLEFIAKSYPEDFFEERYKRKKANENQQLKSLIGIEHQVDLVFDNSPPMVPPNLDFDVTIL